MVIEIPDKELGTLKFIYAEELWKQEKY
jgi:hypothetical protein